MKTIYFHKFSINLESGKGTLICRDGELLTPSAIVVANIGFQARNGSNPDLKFGVLPLLDTKGQPVGISHPDFKKLQATLKAGDEITGVHMSDDPIRTKDGEDTTLFWVRPNI